MTADRLDPIAAPLYDPRAEHDACGVGFVADIGGRHVDRTVPMALEALAALAHRGARGADDTTGDGAGISFPISNRFRRRLLADAGASVGPRRRTAIAMCFLPAGVADEAVDLIESRARAAGLVVAGWRNVPVDASLVAGRLVGSTPLIRQAIVVPAGRMAEAALARALAVVRRGVDAAAATTPSLAELAIVSLSSSTIVYKGLFVGDELGRFYADLRSDELEPRYALFHQRYSTNTFPSWRLAQPFGYLAHNGEINTVRANREYMRGRRAELAGSTWGRRLTDAGPLVNLDGSDSLALDDALELLVLSGLGVDEAIGTLVPPAAGLRGGVEPLPMRSEPWDGPAAIVFGDGRRVGALLDRNGLRPLAMATTADGLVVVSSEAGSVELAPGGISARHRLSPGEMVVVDTATASVAGPSAERSASTRPPIRVAPPRSVDQRRGSGPRQRVAVGLDAEIMRQLVKPMATGGHEAIWSMGDDTPIAPLAIRPPRVTAFLRQAFAQVTNPAIDPERERVVLSLRMAVGRQPAYLGGDPGHVAVIDGPVLDAAAWASLLGRIGGDRVATLDATWPAARGPRGLPLALGRLARQAASAARRGASLIMLSDASVGLARIAVPPVLAVGRVNAELVAIGRRSRTDLAVEAGECFDVHDIAMLLAAGASAVHPWLLMELSADHAGSRGNEDLEPDRARANTIAALEAGLRKVLARMGISTLASYRGGQLFDAVGLEADLVGRCFPAAGSWPGATGAEELGRVLIDRHRRAWSGEPPALEDPGQVRFRGSGELHAFAPGVVKAIQALVGADLDAAGGLDAYRAAVAGPGPRQPRDDVERIIDPCT